MYAKDHKMLSGTKKHLIQDCQQKLLKLISKFKKVDLMICIRELKNILKCTQYIGTAKRILARLHHHLSKFDRSVFLILKTFFLAFIWLVFLSRIYWSSLNHDLKARI